MTDYICCECNLNCEKTRQSIIDMNLNPDSDDDYDRMIFCTNWGDMAIFRRQEK